MPKSPEVFQSPSLDLLLHLYPCNKMDSAPTLVPPLPTPPPAQEGYPWLNPGIPSESFHLQPHTTAQTAQVKPWQYFLKETRFIPHFFFSTEALLTLLCVVPLHRTTEPRFLISNFNHEKTVIPQDSPPHSCCYFCSWFASISLWNDTLCSVPNVHTWPCSTSSSSEHSAQLPHEGLIMFYCNCSFQQMPQQTAALQLQYADDEVLHTFPAFQGVSPIFIYSARKYVSNITI